MKEKIIHLIYLIFRVCPIKKDRIVFSSFNCKSYAGDPREIAEWLLQNSNFEIIWILNKDVQTDIPKRIIRVNTHSFKKIYYYATAHIWVDSHCFYNRWKRKNQYIIQTWHGAIPIKNAEGGCCNYFSADHIRRMRKWAAMTDYALANSDITVALLREGLFYYGPILKQGIPKNDLLVNANDEIRIQLCKKYRLNSKIKYILYAPTCRKADEEDLVNCIQYEKVRLAFENKFHNTWRFLYRGHPIADVSKKEALQDINVIDVTDVEKTQELLVIADAVITDYSSIITDYMLTKKPAFIFAYDYEIYKNQRDFYLPPEELPFPFAKTNEELVNNILSFNDEIYLKAVQLFLLQWNVHETGTATEAVSHLIQNIVYGKKG